MFELSQEKTLIYSDDRSIILTTHRVIQQIDKTRNQIMLDEFQNYEVKTIHSGNYHILPIIFGVASLVLIGLRIGEYNDSNSISYLVKQNFFEFMWLSFPIRLSLFLFVLSLPFLLLSRRYLVRINGWHNHIDFRVRGLKKKSLNKFLKTLSTQSALVKRRAQDSPGRSGNG